MKIWVLLAAVVLAVSCSGGPQIRQAEDPEARVEAEVATREPAASEEPQVPEAPASTAGPAVPPAAQSTEDPEKGDFLVTAEVYSRTLDEIGEFIRALNEIIRSRDYPTWLTYLSEEYIRRVGDPEYLREQSEMPLLKKTSVVLTSLRDYFEHVVAPSRSHATVDDIEFIDENHVKAISSIRGTRGILYHLVRSNDSWKIDVWE